MTAISLALGLLLPLLSLPFFALGYWDKAEPLIIGFHASSALASLAIATALWKQPTQTLERILHPYVLLALAMGLWSLVAAPFVELPVLSLFGAPQSGFGGLWFLNLAALLAAALLAARDRKIWNALCWQALAVTLVVGGIKFLDWRSLSQDGSHLLIFVGAYYGWLAIALPFLVWRDGPPSNRRLAAFTGAGLFVALASQSLAALLAFLAALGLVWTARLPSLTNIGLGRRMATLLAVFWAILPWPILHLSPGSWLGESLSDRTMVQQLVQADIAAHPIGLLFGQGWGRTQDAFHIWLNLSGERLWSPRWIFLSSDYFHSHHWAVESLHAAGIPGLMLTLASLIAIPLFARKDRLIPASAFAAASAVFAGFWFQLSLSVPLSAMAMAALADESAWRPRKVSRHLAWPALALGLAQLLATGLTLAYALAFDTLKQSWNAAPPLALDIPADMRRSDLAAAELIRDALDSFSLRAANEPTPPLGAAIQPMLAFIESRQGSTQDILLLEAGLSAMARIYVTRELAFAATQQQISLWRVWLERLLALAPGRTDLAVPYLSFALDQGQDGEASLWVENLLTKNAQDPVGLHFQGLCLIRAGRRAEGLKSIRAALDAGIERFIPIDPSIKALLGQS